MAMLFSFVFIVFAAFQVVVFREYAFESAWLLAKNATGISDLNDQKRLGAICSTRSRLNSSARVFKKLAHDYPSDNEILSSYAITLVALKKFGEAEPYFKAYFAGGGISSELMYWYGRSLRAQGYEEKAVPWFYNALYYNFSNELASLELFQALNILERRDEAQSLLASLEAQASHEDLKKIWRDQYSSAQKVLIARTIATTTETKKKLMVPSLDGRRFYLPIKIKGLVAGFINSDAAGVETQISENDLLKFDLKAKRLSTTRILIKSMHVGPFEFTNFEASLCANCESSLGGKLLAKFSAYVDGRDKVPYLIMHEE